MTSVVIAISGRAARMRSTRERYFRRVRPVHRFQDAIGAGLQGQVHVFGQFRQVARRRRIKSSRNPIGCGEVKRSRSSPSIACTASSNCTNGLLPSDFRKLMASVKVHDLSEQRDFLHAARDQLAHFAARSRRSVGCVPHRACAGTMQNVQCMLQPCMMETNAVAWRCVERLVADGRSAEPASSSVSRNGKTRIIHPMRPLFLQQLFDVIRDAMKFLRANDEVEMRQNREERVAPRLRHAAEKTEYHSPAGASRSGPACPFCRAPFAPPCRARCRY